MEGFRLSGGKVQRVTTEDACRKSCVFGCKAADFNRVSMTCWHHTAETACQPGRADPRVTHYQKTSCGQLHVQ